DDVGAEVGSQGFGDEDGAVGLLVGFDQGDEEACEGGAGAIEDVGEAVVAGGVRAKGSNLEI
ncbi:MAG: hypothetical protein ACKOEQ_10435, partial [Verrucomicrobiota bacterium]